VLVTVGQSTNFLIEADLYYHVAEIATNGVPVPGGPFHVSSTNFTWGNVQVNGDLRAAFSPNLATNGVPEWWLAGHGLTNGSFNDEALFDHDADAMPTWQEYVAGTDPTNALSLLAVAGFTTYGTNYNTYVGMTTDEWGRSVAYTAIALEVEAVILEWPSVSNRLYRLYRGPSPVAVTNMILTNLPPTPPVNVVTEAFDSALQHFYRIGVSVPP
jgi:hypothetical protein